jgi:hypothetical protein
MQDVHSAMGRLKHTTLAITLTDASQLLTAAVDTALGASVEWAGVLAVMISCETNDCRVAFGVAASSTVGHVLAAGQSLRIPSNDLLTKARIINKTAGSNAVIQVTLES